MRIVFSVQGLASLNACAKFWEQEKVLSARPRPRTWALPSRAVTTGSERCGVAVVRAESALLLTATGLCGGGPGIAATGPCAPLGGLLRALLGLRRVTLLRGAVAASLALVALREMLNPVTVDLHRRLTLIHVSAADSARDNHGVSGADPKTGDQVVVVAPVGDVIERLGKGVESALVVLA